MKIFTLLILLALSSQIFSQTIFTPNNEHRQIEANRKAKALAKSFNQNPVTALEDGRGYDVSYYGLSLDLHPANTNMNGSVEIKATVSLAELSEVVLDFNTFLTVDSIKSEELSLNFVHEHDAGRPSDLLIITLDKSHVQDESFSFTIYYHGPTDFGGTSVFGVSFGHTEVLGRDHIWSLSEPYGARDWWPCKDTALDKADSMDIIYTVPEGWSAAANGKLHSEITNNGRTTFHWKVGYPIATYLVSIAAYEYTRYEDTYVAQNGDSLPIMFFVAPENFENSKPGFFLVDNMIQIFADLYGEYPFMGEKYGHAEASIFGGMEHQTMTTLGPIQFNQGFYSEGLISHELAHQWWGDMVTCASFQDIWLNEGFATYSEALIVEQIYGKQAYKNQIANDGYKGPGTIFVEDTTNTNRIFNQNLSYAKGSFVLHMLRGVVGDDTFFEIMQAWYDNPKTKYGAAYTSDFQQVAEEVSGLNLEKFFQQWIYGEYFPVYAYGHKVIETDSGFNISLIIDQKQTNTGFFWMPIDVQIITESDTLNYVVWDSLQSQSFEFSIDQKPLSVTLDPDDWILKDSKRKLIDPPLNKGTLLLNGLTWNTSGVREAYENRAFWGDAPITFWDFSNEPSEGYPNTLPEPLGIGDLSVDILGEYSTIIWISNKTQSDFDNWQKLPMIDYLNEGGNIILATKFGQFFIDDMMREYLGINWDEKENSLIKNYLSAYSGLVDMPVTSNMPLIALFDTTTANENSTLLFKTTEGFDNAKGAGVWSNPAKGGDFVYLASRPWLFDNDALRANMVYMLDNYMNEQVVSIEESEKKIIPQKFEISNVYPNPFNPIAQIDFSLPQSRNITITIFDLIGKKVATLLNNVTYKAGKHTVSWDATKLASGLYFIQLVAGKNIQTRKAILMK
ncbi:MAG: T9SS C-terminal target domain-containing protein [Calditrichaeota bacterium]|nr:MAG: T9SS C-terminal target domain-containing protein [Calditrichota bacterium]MBL1206171.1 T9SS C-terminal target domain-containing protein [Calditrichota bacterium]NOG45996.1 T9SS type A sorting domain-containing protein [Calditrichota bacterium]